MKKLADILNGILPFLAATLLQGVLYTIITNIYSVLYKEPVLPQHIEYIISVFIIFLCGVIYFIWYLRMPSIAQPGRTRLVLSIKSISLLLLMGVGCQFFISGVISIIEPYFEVLFQDYDKTISSILSGNLALVLLFTILIAPVTEELIFRGVMMNSLMPSIPFIYANILQAAFFGLYHLNVIQSIYAFATGMALGYVYYKYRSILASILLHMFINASSYLLSLVPSWKISLYIVMMVGGCFIFVALPFIVKMKLDEK